MEVNGRKIVLWDCDPEVEDLYHTDRDSAVEDYLDGRDQWEGKITVHGYARMVIPEPTEGDASRLLDDWFETHWEEYIGDDGPDINEAAAAAMAAAALTFLKVVHREFTPYGCEVVHSEEVDVAAWIAEHRPDWPAQRTPEPAP